MVLPMLSGAALQIFRELCLFLIASVILVVASNCAPPFVGIEVIHGVNLTTLTVVAGESGLRLRELNWFSSSVCKARLHALADILWNVEATIWTVNIVGHPIFAVLHGWDDILRNVGSMRGI